MGKILFSTALLLGATAIIWMGESFVGSNVLALTVTIVIGTVYTIGIIELIKFRYATATLNQALSSIKGKVTDLSEWISQLDRSLHVPVRLSIEGERTGLPAPVLTPYLVGLLVMLGLLGTFIGMVDTLKGAVSALEGATEIEAIRAGLANPIRGLSLSFGTSVAGVAASAMLGFMSTISRRDRILVKRILDSKIADCFQDFSLTHHQRKTFKSLQTQTQALPGLSGKLEMIAEKLDQVSERMVTNQELFHTSIKTAYTELASSVDTAHKKNLEATLLLVGDTLKPILKETMTGITNETHTVHKTLTQKSTEHLQELSRQFTFTSQTISNAWKDGLNAHNTSNASLIDHMETTLTSFKETFSLMADSMLLSIDKKASSIMEKQEANDRSRLDMWTDSLKLAQHDTEEHITNVCQTFSGELKTITDGNQNYLQTAINEFKDVSSSLSAKWEETGQANILSQKEISDTLKYTAIEISEKQMATADQMKDKVTELLKSSEQLIQTRKTSEKMWIESHHERMKELTSSITSELMSLREAEELRGEAAVNRLKDLESTLASHLASLGKELEGPMTRLIQTSSEVPRKASEVIENLRNEASKNFERDNRLLEEHQRLTSELNTLSMSITKTTNEQHTAISELVDSSKDMLENVALTFTEHVDSEVSNISKIAENFAVSSVEMASLGEAFSTAVTIFSTSNGNLIENLDRIEESLDKTTERSDEQLGYYVSQAREIIDHCMLSQKAIFEELHQLRKGNPLEDKVSEWKN